MNVILMHNISPLDARTAKYVVYAHVNSSGDSYIGQSSCIVNRWSEHLQIANSNCHPEHNQKFKSALRKNVKWEHYILGLYSNQLSAEKAESAAILFYKPTLNSHPGKWTEDKNEYRFEPLKRDSLETMMNGKPIERYKIQARFTDADRQTIKCKAVRKSGKKHISFECIDDGIKVTISHEKRVGFKEGDIVYITNSAKGKTAYSTTDSSTVSKA